MVVRCGSWLLVFVFVFCVFVFVVFVFVFVFFFVFVFVLLLVVLLLLLLLSTTEMGVQQNVVFSKNTKCWTPIFFVDKDITQTNKH